MDLFPLLAKFAEEAGFPFYGAVDLDLATEALSAHVERYDQWIQAGFAGSMEYLVRGRDRKADPRLLFPKAESVFCVGLPYSTLPAGGKSLLKGPRFARYLRTPDYHTEI